MDFTELEEFAAMADFTVRAESTVETHFMVAVQLGRTCQPVATVEPLAGSITAARREASPRVDLPAWEAFMVEWAEASTAAEASTVAEGIGNAFPI